MPAIVTALAIQKLGDSMDFSDTENDEWMMNGRVTAAVHECEMLAIEQALGFW